MLGTTCGQCSISWGNACLPSHELHIDYELINKCVRVFLVVSKIAVENLEEWKNITGSKIPKKDLTPRGIFTYNVKDVESRHQSRPKDLVIVVLKNNLCRFAFKTSCSGLSKTAFYSFSGETMQMKIAVETV